MKATPKAPYMFMKVPPLIATTLIVFLTGFHSLASDAVFPDLVVLTSNWQLQDVALATNVPEEISKAGYQATNWYPATVPGTVLTTLVNNKVYPEPLYGENNRPDKIPETLSRTSYWYRTTITIPSSYTGRTIWLNFDGINYSAEVWVNGKEVGAMRGAFARGVFDISSVVKAGQQAVLAVRVSPQPHPGNPHEHNIENGLGGNGGITAIDGATFLCAIGWDWIPGIRDRDTGIWQKVFLSASGPVRIQEPLVTSDLPLPKLDSADLKIQAFLRNDTPRPQKGILKGMIGNDVAFQQSVEIPAATTNLGANSLTTTNAGTTLVTLDSSNTPPLHLKNPKLWWPNGYGPQNLYPVTLSFEQNGSISDEKKFNIGIRKISYALPGSDNLALSVNGVPVMCKGGDWGMDEAMKRIPRERLEAQIRLHKEANYTMIRNWVGQSTGEDFYELCDKYGIMLWDEFFQPNPGDGPNPTDLETYEANAREKIVRFRNNPSIAVWCGRNEGRPPVAINDALQKLMTELEPCRVYQPSSTDGHGVHSGGPYHWRAPWDYYNVDAPFKTEIGSVSVPTLEAVQSMMPRKDWESINDAWGEHDLARGAQHGDTYPGVLARRYGKLLNLADFVRKAQLANYEAFRAMYEGRFVKLFSPVSGVITWMSNPAQPSFVWQLYSWDLEPNASLFGTRKACEAVHIMLNENNGHLFAINNTPTRISGATASVAIYNLDGTLATQNDLKVEAAPSAATDLGVVAWPQKLSSVHFVKLQLKDSTGKLISDNFYWRDLDNKGKDLRELDTLPSVTLESTVARHDADGKCLLDVTLHNTTDKIALMAHLQLRRSGTGERVLPVYYSDNYVSLAPGDSKTITIETDLSALHGDKPLVVLDGWNVAVKPFYSAFCDLDNNKQALPSSWPITNIAIKWFPRPLDQIKISCGQNRMKEFVGDRGYDAGDIGAYNPKKTKDGKIDPKTEIDLTATPNYSKDLYSRYREGETTYTFPFKPAPTSKGYLVRLHFAETQFDALGRRVFNVDINGKPALVNFDIFQAAGGKLKSVFKEIPGIFPDKEGNIVINFRNGSGSQPKINAIEVIPMQ